MDYDRSMKRLLACATLLVLATASADAQTPRLCFITFDPGNLQSNRYDAFFGGLKALGYETGKNLQIDYRSAEGQGDRFASLAAECVKQRSAVIVVTTTPAALAAKKATTSIPIVMTALADPVGSGLVQSLSRPGGNVTGPSLLAPVLAAKRLEVLKEAFPGVSRVLVLSYLTDPIAGPQIKALETAARRLNVRLLVHEIRAADDVATAFDAGIKEGADAVMVTNESIFMVNRKRVVELAAKHRLPGMYFHRAFAEAGGLLVYAANYADLYRRAATYVDRILKGAKPADLPIEQPTELEFVINLKVAKALGISIPATVLIRANQVIE